MYIREKEKKNGPYYYHRRIYLNKEPVRRIAEGSQRIVIAELIVNRLIKIFAGRQPLTGVDSGC